MTLFTFRDANGFHVVFSHNIVKLLAKFQLKTQNHTVVLSAHSEIRCLCEVPLAVLEGNLGIKKIKKSKVNLNHCCLSL